MVVIMISLNLLLSLLVIFYYNLTIFIDTDREKFNKNKNVWIWCFCISVLLLGIKFRVPFTQVIRNVYYYYAKKSYNTVCNNLIFTGIHMSQTKEGSWYPAHIRSYYKFKGNENLHFIFYEDIIKVIFIINC